MILSERQLKKYKKKIISKHQNAANFKKEFIEKETDLDDEIHIIRSKKFRSEERRVGKECRL